MKRVKKCIRLLAFIAIGILLLHGLNRVLVKNPDVHSDRVITAMYNLPKEAIDVIWMGTSHMEFGCSPMELYETTGIVSYNLATSAQPISGTFYLLNEAYRCGQKPCYVVVDASNLFFSDTEDNQNISLRYIMDSMVFSRNKWDFIQSYQEKDGADDVNACIFPIIKYHTRVVSSNL